MLTAANVPRPACASVQATTSTIKSTRQTMVSLSELITAQIRVSVGRGMEALEKLEERGAVGVHRAGVARHLDEPGAAVEDREAGDQAALLLPVAGEVVEGDDAGRGFQRLARGVHGALVDRRKAQLSAPPVDVGELAARRTG